MKNYFQKIITLFTGNDYPESTQQDFYKWLVDEEHTSEKDEALQKLWDEAHKRGTATDMQESYELLKKNAGIPPIQRKRTIRPIRMWQAVAAVFFIVAASSVYLSTIGKDAEENLIQQYIPTAEIRTLTLPDGTQVQLNSQSTLLYPQNFTGKNRSVFLIGEANLKSNRIRNIRSSSNPMISGDSFGYGVQHFSLSGKSGVGSHIDFRKRIGRIQ